MEDEIEKIRRKKLEELLKRQKTKISWPEKPMKITDEKFEEILRKYSLVLIDFWAPWCFPCKMIAPLLEEIAKEYKGKLLVGKMNVDENPITPMRFRIMSIPTLILFRNGRPIEKIVGVVPKNYLKEKINPYLN